MKVGITTFGGDGGRSGISQYIIQLIREFARQPDDCTFEVIGYANERAVFVPPSNSIAYLPFGDRLRSPVRNIFCHQYSFPRPSNDPHFTVPFFPPAIPPLPPFPP